MKRSQATFVLLALAVSVFLWLALASLTRAPALADSASIYYTTPNGTGTACTRAAPCQPNTAVNKAAVGDSVYLSAGTYTGSGGAVISITKSLALLCGWNGSPTGGVVRNATTYRSVIDGENERRGIFVLATGAVGIDGCVVIRGTAVLSPSVGHGGGIFSASAMPLFTNNTITSCVASNHPDRLGSGGGIYVVNAPAGGTISRNWLRDNVAASKHQGFGGAISLSNARGLSVNENTLLHNAASITDGTGYGGGLYMDECTDVVVSSNEIRDNAGQIGLSTFSGSYGGGVAIDRSTYISLTDNVLRGNTASFTGDALGGAIAVWMSRNIWLSENLIDDNTASAGATGTFGRGGGVSSTYANPLRAERNTVVRNVASEHGTGYGGGFFLARSTYFTLTNNLIADNGGTLEGGALAIDVTSTQPVTGTLLHNSFARNLSTGYDQHAIHAGLGPINVNGKNNLFCQHGCAVYAGAGSAITLTRSLFFANTVADTCGVGVVNQTPITGLDPLLKSNLRLRPGSPAIDAGVETGVTVDLDADVRPIGPAPDIGADEAPLSKKLYLPVLGRAIGP